jgi:uncharacterized protein YdeI (YjbR/CyaY-like superfamily)
MGEAECFEARTRAEWRGWLADNCERESGVWLVTYKKSTGVGDLDYAASVEEALCFGWVDSRPGKVDADRSKLWFTKRKAKSVWSKINKERIARLMEAKQMMPAGLAAVALAKKNGMWEALDDVEAMVVPPDLTQALKANVVAQRHFEAFPPSAKKGILQWIQSAKQAATREKRIAETVALAAQNLRANSWPKV